MAVPSEFKDVLYLRYKANDDVSKASWVTAAQKLLETSPISDSFQIPLLLYGSTVWRVARRDNDKPADKKNWALIRSHLEPKGYDYKGVEGQGVVFELRG